MVQIQSFTHLQVWRKGHQLVIAIYKATKEFPDSERYGIVDQLRRAVVSVTNNIAEGFGRKTTKDKASFYTIAKGSIIEVQNLLLISRDLHYLSKEDFQGLSLLSIEVHKLINTVLKLLKT